MAEAVGVIHMNGRLYDPHFGRFLQADPLVQSPQNLQSWNRYSYAFNNPLAYTDPSGHMSVGDALRTVAAIAIAYYAPYLAPYLGESTAAVSAGVFYGIGGALPVRGGEDTFYNASGGLTTAGYAVRTLAYGAAGGVMETLQGGRFGHGFVSAGVSAALGPTIGQIGNDAAGTLASAVVAWHLTSQVESSRMGHDCGI
jgi:RHS repeat-associated protein